MLNKIYLIIITLLVALILSLFFLVSKNLNWESSSFSTFECGFTSYFFSRLSFSVHFFLIALIFLFLDLEICLSLPFLKTFTDELGVLTCFTIFVACLLAGVYLEWAEGSLEWKN